MVLGRREPSAVAFTVAFTFPADAGCPSCWDTEHTAPPSALGLAPLSQSREDGKPSLPLALLPGGGAVHPGSSLSPRESPRAEDQGEEGIPQTAQTLSDH